MAVRRRGGLSHQAGAFDLRLCRGPADPGESLLGAAERLTAAAALTGSDLWAVDLSGPVARFAADVPDSDRSAFQDLPAPTGEDPDDADHLRRTAQVPSATVGFRPMTRADLADAVRWTHAPHVVRWWDDEAADLAAAERHYGPAIDGTEPTRRWVVELNGRSVGMVQDYRVGDHPEWALLTAKPDAVGFDYLVGEAAWVGRGTGARMLWRFLCDVVVPAYPDAPECFAAPDHRNAASLRVLDKLGFTRGLWFDEPQRDGGVATLIGCSLDVAAVFGTSRRRVTHR